ncbi:hypothetical protein TARUN_9904 [Trichoderma arundinaceum]|uniref:Uncharacterized protein n=1 Tax=Trichoderma arundinaceum TaxID=490622 RepID=A0A395N9K4_TRIAR|nr:hypothetical protein TARUN_9904 [Trichoderma arundinaceum]
MEANDEVDGIRASPEMNSTSANKENWPNLMLPPPRPARRIPRQERTASKMYRLGPRVKLTEKDLDFTIYRDETAHDIPPPRRQYYGSNMPALPEVKNGIKFKYALEHELRHKFRPLMQDAWARRDLEMMDKLRDNYYEYVTVRERVTGSYGWSVACNPMDVCLWIEDKGYDRRWTRDQKVAFRVFLIWMGKVVHLAARHWSDPIALRIIEKHNIQEIPKEFETLGLPNLTISKDSVTFVTFTPSGEDKTVAYRAAFTEQEQELIDQRWPEYWAPGEEAKAPLPDSEESKE